MSEQLGFDLPTVTALGRDDYLVAPSNQLAVSLIEGWREWPMRKLILTGPEGSGKTHLTHVWANAASALIVQAGDIAPDTVPELARGSLAVEDVDRLAGVSAAQTTLFHLHNLMLSEGHFLLMSGTGAPTSWALELPDLQSRLTGTPTVALAPPDDALLAAVLAKLFADRQLRTKPELINYLVRRIDRSFAAAREIVSLLDTASLAQKRPISRSLASEVLDKTKTFAR